MVGWYGGRVWLDCGGRVWQNGMMRWYNMVGWYADMVLWDGIAGWYGWIVVGGCGWMV